MLTDQVSLLELDSQQDVSCRGDREEQVRERHQRRHPECEKPTGVERVSYQSVWPWNREPHGLIRSAQQVEPDLTQAEEVEVVEQECRDQHQSPAESE